MVNELHQMTNHSREFEFDYWVKKFLGQTFTYFLAKLWIIGVHSLENQRIDKKNKFE
jgi:hypothetical protein